MRWFLYLALALTVLTVEVSQAEARPLRRAGAVRRAPRRVARAALVRAPRVVVRPRALFVAPRAVRVRFLR
jgi:hypothetical protein